MLSGANVVTYHCTQNDKSDVIYTYNMPVYYDFIEMRVHPIYRDRN